MGGAAQPSLRLRRVLLRTVPAHRQRGLPAAYCIRYNADSVLDRFIASGQIDIVAEIFPGPDARRKLRRKHHRAA